MAIIRGEKHPYDEVGDVHVLHGTQEDDEFYGSDADEVLRSNGGNDHFEGGGGYDIAEFWGESQVGGLFGKPLDITVTDTDVAIQGTDSDGSTVERNHTIGGGIEEIALQLSHFDDVVDAKSVTNMRIVIEAHGGDDYITGGSFDDGDSLDDFLSGNFGDDILAGYGGDDALFGGPGNDQLYGGEGNDFLYGDGTGVLMGYPSFEQPPETLLEDSYKDIESTPNYYWAAVGAGPGNQFDDQLYGNEGDDYLYGGEGDDSLLGGTDNDILIGGSGDDYLLGTDPSMPQQGEVDWMTGGLGNDLFLLGNIYSSFYISGNDAAIITDLDVTSDTVRLHGNASQYSLGMAIGGAGLYRLAGSNNNPELIAIFENTSISNLSLTASYFDYVSV